MSDVGIQWIPVRAAAKMLKVSRQRVHRLCRVGELTSRNMEGTVLVSLRSVHSRLVGCEAVEVDGGGDR